jgi:hypothetical protein
MAPSLFKIISAQTVLVPRLVILHCEALDGEAIAGCQLRTPDGRDVVPMSVSPKLDGQQAFQMAFAPSSAVDALRPGQLLCSA